MTLLQNKKILLKILCWIYVTMMKLSILSNCILKSSSIKTHFRRAILTTSFYRIWGSFFKREQIEFYLKIFDFLLMKYSLIKRHWWYLTKRLIECPSILKKDNYSVSNRFSTFYFSKSFTWSSWLENFESTSCFLFIEKEKCSHFCENALILLLERGPWPE